MDRDTIIRLARKAEGEEQHHGMWRMHVEDLERFAALAYERGFVDGMSEQARRSVDKAVNSMAKPITAAEMSAWVKDTWEKCQAEAWQKPSGSFVLWQNTLCNPLADSISMTHSAWHDGHASGVKEERKRICDLLLDMHAKEERHNYYLFIANIIKESK